jgi:hypothetical protein
VGALLPTAREAGLPFVLTPSLSKEDAEAAARREAAAPEAVLHEATTLNVFDLSLLTETPSDPHLAWHVRLAGRAGEHFVDAHSGRILFSLPT